MMAFFFMVAPYCRSRIVHGTLLVVVEEAVEGDETVGIVGAVACGPTVPTIGDTLGVGTAAAELTPRLPISVESNGIPARVLVVADDVEVGVDDAVTLLEPEPHIPDNPAVAAIPEVIDNPEVADIPAVIPDAAWVPGVAVATVDAVAGVAAPLSITPPPS
jgi:hypothetical protein